MIVETRHEQSVRELHSQSKRKQSQINKKLTPHCQLELKDIGRKLVNKKKKFEIYGWSILRFVTYLCYQFLWRMRIRGGFQNKVLQTLLSSGMLLYRLNEKKNIQKNSFGCLSIINHGLALDTGLFPQTMID